MWGHVEKHRKQKPRKLRLLSSTKGEENTVFDAPKKINDHPHYTKI